MGNGNKRKPPISRTIVNIAGLLIFSTSSKVGRIHLRPSSLDSRPDAWRHRRASSGYILGYSHRCCPYWPCVNDELTKLYICTVPTLHYINHPLIYDNNRNWKICPGDLPAHDVWMQSQHTNIHVAKVVSKTQGNLFLLIFSRIYLILVI